VQTNTFAQAQTKVLSGGKRKKMAARGKKDSGGIKPFKSEKYMDPDKKSAAGIKAFDGGGRMMNDDKGMSRVARTGSMKKRMPKAQAELEAKQMRGGAKKSGSVPKRIGKKATISKAKQPVRKRK
jgi:hypothetical protein